MVSSTPMPLPRIDAALRHPCPQVPPAPTGDLPTLAANHTAAMKLYDDCRNRHGKLVAAVDERDRIEAERAARDAAPAAAARPWWRFWKR